MYINTYCNIIIVITMRIYTSTQNDLLWVYIYVTKTIKFLHILYIIIVIVLIELINNRKSQSIVISILLTSYFFLLANNTMIAYVTHNIWLWVYIKIMLIIEYLFFISKNHLLL